VFDVHVQRSPISGKVVKVEYQNGKFLDARNPRASLENEKNSILIENADFKIVVTQIAGFIARRIVCWVKEGSQLHPGERYGLIRFGSQVDVLLPPSVQVVVKVGDRVVSGETVLARWM
jgi:phosphatidylserine decarboxylase